METSNFSNVFKAFKRNYTLVPLEVFGKDPFKTLISTILSSRTKDEVTLEASKRLFIKASNLGQLKSLNIKEIEKFIYPVGFYRTKAKYLKNLNITKVPNTRDELMKINGVGRKTANLVLNRAFGIPAIAVDTHVHRICNVLGWVKTKTPQQTEMKLIKIIPEKYWPDLNRLFVSIGRQYTTNKKLIEFLKKEELID
ncbi:MAG: endonuclease III [Microgenomates group bacterium]